MYSFVISWPVVAVFYVGAFDRLCAPTSSMANQNIELLLLGHSFVHRMDNHLRLSSQTNFFLPTRSHKVCFLGQSRAQVGDVMPLFQRHEADLHLVILDIGIIVVLHRSVPLSVMCLFCLFQVLASQLSVPSELLPLQCPALHM